MAWYRVGDELSFELIRSSLLAHMCITWSRLNYSVEDNRCYTLTKNGLNKISDIKTFTFGSNFIEFDSGATVDN